MREYLYRKGISALLEQVTYPNMITSDIDFRYWHLNITGIKTSKKLPAHNTVSVSLSKRVLLSP